MPLKVFSISKALCKQQEAFFIKKKIIIYEYH